MTGRRLKGKVTGGENSCDNASKVMQSWILLS